MATGPITVTFILALALGAAAGIPGADPVVAGFGLVALVGVAPVLAVLMLGVMYRRAESVEDTPAEPSSTEHTPADSSSGKEA